jgi:hypothetical protein
MSSLTILGIIAAAIAMPGRERLEENEYSIIACPTPATAAADIISAGISRFGVRSVFFRELMNCLSSR